jgi:hypothetical protein
VTVTYTPVPVATLSGPGLTGNAFTFATQAEGTVGSAEVLTLTNIGSAPLVVSRLLLSGANPDDYFLGNRCQQPVPAAPGSNSCQIAIRFAPQSTGPSSAKLTIGSNAPAGDLNVALSGTGGGLPQGPSGPVGPAGPAGSVELVTCTAKKVKGKGGGKAKTVQHCTATVVSGPVTFNTATTAKARLSRDGRAVALGEERRGNLTFHSRHLQPGRYTLTLTYRRGGWLVTRHRSVVVSD